MRTTLKLRLPMFLAVLFAVTACENGGVASVDGEPTAVAEAAATEGALDPFQSAADRCPLCVLMRSAKETRMSHLLGPDHPRVVRSNYNLMQELRRLEAAHGQDSQEALFVREDLLIELEIARRHSPTAADRLEGWLNK